jgi:tetratricopeptide (TPR) repeat protein
MAEPLLSLCVIARDEEPTLPRCIQSAASYVDETIVVDTGSGGTRTCAARSGARVVDHVWRDDFSAARNAGLEAARGRFVLMLDADEWIDSGPHPASLRALLSEGGIDAFGVEVADRMDDGATRHSTATRLFRNKTEHRYTGAVNERILPLASTESEFATSGIVLGHDGHLLGSRSGRSMLRQEMLRRMIAAGDEGASVRYLLARELVALRGGRAVPGLHLAEAVELLEWVSKSDGLDADARVDAARLHAAALLALGFAKEAAGVLARSGDRGVACDLLRADCALAGTMEDLRAVRSAYELARGCFDRETRDQGPYAEPALAGAIARARCAEVLARLSRFDEGRAMAEEAAKLQGGGAAPYNALACIERAAGKTAEALQAYLEALRVDPKDPWAWAGLGEVLLSSGSPKEALDPLRNAVLLAPRWDAVEEALTSALLLAGCEEEIERFFASQGEMGSGAQAGVILASAVIGEPCPFERVDPMTGNSVRRILGRVATAGRPDLLHRLALGLRTVSAGG